MIVTGEASGDLHGANLIRAAGQVDPGLSFFGVGGRLMREAGCDILIPGEELAVMGLVEVLGHFPTIWRAFNRLKKILHGPRKPDVLILIDFPDFNLRLARQAKAAGVPVLYYVSPQVWAWRRGRVKKIAAVVDRLAAILPFEPDFYRDQDIEVEYVGNPLTDEAHISRDRSTFLAEHGLDEERPVVGLFPGSRRNELRYIFETIIESAQRLHRKNRDIQFLLPVASSLQVEEIEEHLAAHDLPVTLVQDNVYDAIGGCDAVITVSGTVTLQIALVGTPMAILYKMSPLTYAIGKRLVKVPHIGLANIVAGERVAQEFIQDEANPEAVAAEVLRLLDDADYRRQVLEGLKLVRERIGEP
ncbi:MAG: lipid-A-disaccharide synthase, partial [Desulfuromonadales bacterium]|nr:lipid-A-disaccharide synthase [Desulfuromonadales bacterium]NIS43335.1 lipid-A-disaccharide synthase [Desulfuromonadales bacterium]